MAAECRTCHAICLVTPSTQRGEFDLESITCYVKGVKRTLTEQDQEILLQGFRIHDRDWFSGRPD
jgi:UDP-glucose 6-dehydrogenase